MGFRESVAAAVATLRTLIDAPPVRAAAPPAQSMDKPARHSFSVEIPPEILEAITGAGVIAPPISRAEALQVPAVIRVRNLIAGTLSTLPIEWIDRDNRPVRRTSLLEQIDPDIPNAVTLAYTYEDLLFEGVSWWRVLAFDWEGWPTEARHLPLDSVFVSPDSASLPSQRQITPDQPFPVDGRVYVDGLPVDDSDVIRFDSPNPPLLVHAAGAIRAAHLLDQTAGLYASNPHPLGYFTDEEGADPLDDAPSSANDGSERSEIDKVLDDWETARKKRAWGYMAGLKAVLLQWSPEQLQLADARQHAVLEIARAAGVDPEDLGVSTTSRTYQNGETRRQDLTDFTLAAYMVAMQDRLSMRDLTPRTIRAKIRLDHFLRSDTLTRMQAYEIGERVGAITTEEIRAAEDRPPLTPAQQATRRERAAPSTPAMPPTPAEPARANGKVGAPT